MAEETQATTAEAPVAPMHRDERHSEEFAAQRIAGILGAETPPEDPSDEPSAPSETEQVEAAGEVSLESPENDGSEPSNQDDPETSEGETTEDVPEAEPELPSSLAELAQAFEAEPERFNDLKVTAKVDGEEVEVTLSEALAGYQRTADYTRKTTELSEQRSQFEQAVQEAETELRSRAQELAALTKTIQHRFAPQPPDPKLMQTNPGAYLQQKEAYEGQKRALQAALGDHQRMTQAEMAKQQQAYQTHLEAERQKMVTNWPELGDENSPARTQLVSYLKERGFSEKDIGGIADHRMIGVVMDAMRGHSVETADPGKKIQKPKVTKTVKANAPRQGEDRKLEALASARRNHRRNPKSTEAAADRIRAILG